MSLKRLTACPLSSSPPFAPPWKRPLQPDTRRRLMGWLAELLPGVAIDIVEWVGADPRHPLHAVVASFPSSQQPSITLYRKVDEIGRHHLVEALGMEQAAVTPADRTRARRSARVFA